MRLKNLVEFWAVATRARGENGMGMDTWATAREMAKLRRLFYLLAYTPEVPEIWQRMVTEQEICGKQTHDAHLVAIMQANAVTNVLTFNMGHFARFAGITVLDPADVERLK